jgi:hypothetical protein
MKNLSGATDDNRASKTHRDPLKAGQVLRPLPPGWLKSPRPRLHKVSLTYRGRPISLF